MSTKPRTPSRPRAATDAILELAAAGAECSGTLADQIRALAAREDRTAATLAETQRLLAETTRERNVSNSTIVTAGHALNGMVSDDDDGIVKRIGRLRELHRRAVQEAQQGELRRLHDVSVTASEARKRHDALAAELSDVRKMADERGEALARIATTLGMAPHPPLVADQAIASITSLRARVDAASANVAALAVLAAVCEMLAPESHASVTAKDYVTLARQAVSAARGES